MDLLLALFDSRFGKILAAASTGSWVRSLILKKDYSKNLVMNLTKKVMEEVKHNLKRGVGSTGKPFELQGHRELHSYEGPGELTVEDKQRLAEVIELGTVCNNNPVRPPRRAFPGRIKSKERELVDYLEQHKKSI